MMDMVITREILNMTTPQQETEEEITGFNFEDNKIDQRFVLHYSISSPPMIIN